MMPLRTRFGKRWIDADNRGRKPPPDANARRWRKARANTMTMKTRLEVHKQIVQENERKLTAWKGGAAA